MPRDLVETSSIHLKHHPELYFSDGDVVLSAQNAAQTLVMMRIHRFTLCHNSPVFADMFALPAAQGVNAVYDGVPVVDMPDAAEDLAGVLGILYNTPHALRLTRCIDFPEWPPETFAALALVTKYEIDAVRTRIVENIEADWPRDIQAWFEFHGSIEIKSRWWDLVCIEEGTMTPVEYQVPEPVSAIRLATRFNIPSILPAAFYRLAITDVKCDLCEGVCHGITNFGAEWHGLDTESWLRVSRGRNRLIGKYFEMEAVYRRPRGRCESVDRCTQGRKKLLKRHKSAFGIDYVKRPDILGLLFDALHSGAISWEVCEKCTGVVDRRMKEMVDTIWQELPNIFELPR